MNCSHRRRLSRITAALSAEERHWLLERAERVGGLTQAFIHLVRLNILADALLETSVRVRSLEAELLGDGAAHSSALQHADELLDRCLAFSLTRRFLHAADWTRPAAGRDRRLYDDPADPLPDLFTRRLIREGRRTFNCSNRVWRAKATCH